MEFLEKDLEEIIYENLSSDSGIELLQNKGLEILLPSKVFRQLRIGNYGIADLITVERDYGDVEFEYACTVDGRNFYKEHQVPKLRINVYELKKDKIGISAYLQALRYFKGISLYLEKRRANSSPIYEIEYKIILIGKELDLSGAFCFIPSFDDNIEFYTYKYGINGLEFKNENGYKLIRDGFKLITNE